ncbi:MAG TPA: hypothetical protein VFR65_08765 [Nitrososphaeraceae archaeon]|nr:hypothetical protein [Nitrososphaeraceae archaeon]
MRTINLILLSPYSIIFRISDIVGGLSFAARFIFGAPISIRSHLTSNSFA